MWVRVDVLYFSVQVTSLLITPALLINETKLFHKQGLFSRLLNILIFPSRSPCFYRVRARKTAALPPVCAQAQASHLA